MTTLSTLLALLAVLASTPLTAHHGRATTFGPAATDPSNRAFNGVLICSHALEGRWRSVDPAEMVVALPPWMAPCGAWIVVCLPRTGRCAVARKMDVGPRAAMLSRGDRQGINRGAIDTTEAVRRAVGFDGSEAVTWWRVDR